MKARKDHEVDSDSNYSKQIFSRQTKRDAGDDHSRKSNAKDNNDVKSSEAKKRQLQDDDPDLEMPDAKRVRQDLDSVPLSPPIPNKKGTLYSRKRQPVPITSHTNADGSGFGAQYDEIPQAKQNRQQTRAKTMKKKDGQVAPPRPVTRKQNKKKDGVKKTVQRKPSVKLEDADNTLVEQSQQLKTDEVMSPIHPNAMYSSVVR